MTHKEYITELSKRVGKDSNATEAMVSTMVKCITQTMEEGDTLRIPDFGKWEVRKQYERVIVHPDRATRKLVPPRLSVAFTPSFVVEVDTDKEG